MINDSPPTAAEIARAPIAPTAAINAQGGALLSAAEHHRLALRAALRAIQAAPTQAQRLTALADLAALFETPAASLAHRLIDLCPSRDRATLRSQIAP